MRIDQFTEAAQEAFEEAEAIMHQHRHGQLDVEHIFLAMLRRPDGLTGRVIDHLGVAISAVAERVERELEKLPKVYGQYYGRQIPITARIVRLNEGAEEQANRLDDGLIGVEHFLIALSAEPDGPTAEILRSFDITPERLDSALAAVRGAQNAEDAGADRRE